jgi:hypothetical protein
MSHDFSWIPEPDIEVIRPQLPALTYPDAFVSNFAIFRLHFVLADFGVGQFEGETVIKWFWKTAGTWPNQPSQESFDRYARRRIADHVGYTRRYLDACSVVGRLYDKAHEDGVTFNEVMEAIEFLAKPEEIPVSSIFTNGDRAILDLTKRTDFPKLIKVDTSFLPTMGKLWPVDIVRVGRKDVVMKRVPVGSIVRDVPIRKLVFGEKHQSVGLLEMDEAIESRNGDPLDLRVANLYSAWEEETIFQSTIIPDEFPEVRDTQGTRMLRPNNGGKPRKRLRKINHVHRP